MLLAIRAEPLTVASRLDFLETPVPKARKALPANYHHDEDEDTFYDDENYDDSVDDYGEEGDDVL